MKFHNLLELYLKKAGLNKADLARKLDVSTSYIVNITKGHDNPPTPERLEQIATILKLDEKEKIKLVQLAFDERVREKNQGSFDMLPEKIAVQNIKDVKIPVVSMAKGTDIGGFEFAQLEPHDYEYINFSGCKAVRISGSSMAPLAYDGQRVIYSEQEEVMDGDLVFIGLKGQGQFFKRYHKDAKNGIVTLLSINIANHGPLNTKVKEIEFMYKVVGVKF